MATTSGFRPPKRPAPTSLRATGRRCKCGASSSAPSSRCLSEGDAVFALVDVNNMYVSCERVFKPSLNGRPVVVLSANDGCAIARSNEAKDLGIKMAQPWFQIRHLERDAGLVALSANFELYGDMSSRMMTV